MKGRAALEGQRGLTRGEEEFLASKRKFSSFKSLCTMP
jgi:hypothetical protein